MRFHFIVLGCVFAATQVHAQWVNRPDNDPFGVGENAISVVAANGYEFGFRCKSKEKFWLFFRTTEELPSKIYNIDGKPTQVFKADDSRHNMELRVDNALPVEVFVDATHDDKGHLSFMTMPKTEILRSFSAEDPAEAKIIAAYRKNDQTALDFASSIITAKNRIAVRVDQHLQVFGFVRAADALSNTLTACGLK